MRRLSAALPRDRFTAGWIVVGATFIVLMADAGLGFYGLAIYLAAITREQGISTSSVSAATSLFFVVSGVTGRLVAPLIARIDLRWVLAAGGGLCAVSLVLLGRVTDTWQVFAVYVLFGVGFAAAGLVPTTTVITRWFHRRRALALSIASTGLSVGGLTLTRWASRLIDEDGMAGAAPWLGLTYVVLMVVAVPFVFPSPAARGLRPDGDVIADGDGPVVVEGVPYDRAIHSRYFGFATAAFVCFMGAQVGAIAQLAKLGEERVSVDTGALAVSVLALSSVVARLIGGFLAPRLPLTAMTAGLAMMQALAMASLAVATSEAAILLSAVLFGATIGNLLMLQPLLIADVFGVRDYPRVFSLNQLIVSAGVAAGPFLLGYLHDANGYRLAYLVACVVSLVGSMLLLAAGSAERTRLALA
ncbi:MAG TPA: MFS transporter [Acidimicrobiales bacterium]|nr:MFS transporter [Acidimicrobiales bacterium]